MILDTLNVKAGDIFQVNVPNQRAMILLDNGELETEDEGSDTDSMPPLEEVDEKEIAINGEVLVTRRTLSMQVKEESMEQ